MCAGFDSGRLIQEWRRDESRTKRWLSNSRNSGGVGVDVAVHTACMSTMNLDARLRLRVRGG